MQRIGKRLVGLWTLCVLTSTLWGQENPPDASGELGTTEQPGVVEVFGRTVLNAEAGPPGSPVALAEPMEGGKYWIGVGCTAEVPEALRAQLGLEAPQGLLVYDVVAEGPGMAAGIKPHDILLTAKHGDAKALPLTSVPQLIELVQQTGTKPLVLELLRAGKPVVVTVEPKERTKTGEAIMIEGDALTIVAEPDVRFEELRRLLADVEKRVGTGKQTIAFRVAGPIVPTKPPHAGLDGIFVAITKQGNEPGQITVKKSEQTWNVREHELDQLPPDIRDHVRLGLRSTGQNQGSAPRPATVKPAVPVPPHAVPSHGVIAWPVTTPMPTLTQSRPVTAAEFEQLATSLKRLHEQQAAALQEQSKALLTELKALREAIEKK